MLEPSSLSAIAVYLYALYEFVVLIVKSGKWIRRLYNAFRRRFPGYDRFWTLRTESLNSKGRTAK